MSRTKKTPMQTTDELIATVTAELEELQSQIKAKKAELKQLKAQKEAEEQQRLIEAVRASGKTIEEVLQLLGE